METDFKAMDQMAIPQGTITAPEESNPPPMCSTEEMVRCPGCDQSIMVEFRGKREVTESDNKRWMINSGSAECQVCGAPIEWLVIRVAGLRG